jgi:hypothetical protein
VLTLLGSLALLVAVVAPLVGWVVYADRRRRAAFDRGEEVG